MADRFLAARHALIILAEPKVVCARHTGGKSARSAQKNLRFKGGHKYIQRTPASLKEVYLCYVEVVCARSARENLSFNGGHKYFQNTSIIKGSLFVSRRGGLRAKRATFLQSSNEQTCSEHQNGWIYFTVDWVTDVLGVLYDNNHWSVQLLEVMEYIARHRGGESARSARKKI